MLNVSPPQAPQRADSILKSSAPARVSADQQLIARIHRALSATGHASLRNVRIAAEGGRIRLHGVVPSWFMKQVAQSAALGIADVQSLENHLIVR